eukprot:TRINITY_DN68447_c0_g1_i1.p1 TRINITY_DN68447_c0_g1~~TRINITY_DN68447_c0_g1_i1.p1  ORF type:complete len:708 (-),score=97.62 TRINITY_DN68447_c0_g1_i1:55-2178(-)
MVAVPQLRPWRCQPKLLLALEAMVELVRAHSYVPAIPSTKVSSDSPLQPRLQERLVDGCIEEDVGGNVPVESTFCLCCQAQTEASARASGTCESFMVDCSHRAQCRKSSIVSRGRAAVSVLDSSRDEIGLQEMRVFFELLALPYLTQADTDPVFLDAEFILPSVLLTVGSDIASTELSSSLGPVIVDVGAFMGFFSFAAIATWDALAATYDTWPSRVLSEIGEHGGKPLLLPPVHALALEPAGSLCANITTRAPRAAVGRVTAICAAAGAASGTEVLHCPQSPAAGLGLAGRHLVDDASCGSPEAVRVVSLDDLAIEHGIDEISVLKVDAEGTDDAVLRGATQLLQQGRIRYLIFEAGELWRRRAETEMADGFQPRAVSLHDQLLETLNFLASTGGYQCFLVAPEALLPLSPPWFSDLYTSEEHTFNVLCGQSVNPALETVIRLYTANPRATQLALAALRLPEVAQPLRPLDNHIEERLPLLAHEARCFACRKAIDGDEALRAEAHEIEVYLVSLHQHIIKAGWGLPHVHFVQGRLLQGAGDLVGSSLAFEPIAHEFWPASYEVHREQHRLKENRTLLFLRHAAALSNNTFQKLVGYRRPSASAEAAVQLGWLHTRPGSGALFGAQHLCAAEAWHRRAGRAMHPVGAFYVGLSVHYGQCSGRMTQVGLREAGQWYHRASRWGGDSFEAKLARRVLSAIPWSSHSRSA